LLLSFEFDFLNPFLELELELALEVDPACLPEWYRRGFN
jgi:hypothetical protein